MAEKSELESPPVDACLSVSRTEQDLVSDEKPTQHDAEESKSEFDPLSREVPWSIWSTRDKKLMVFAAGFSAILSPISGQIYFPALNAIATDLQVSNSLVNLSVTTYLIMQGLAPSFVGTLSDESGRRPAYLGCFAIYTVANLGLALQNSYPALMVLRAIQSAGSSGTVALANAVAADLVTPSERGKYVAYTSVAPQFGPAVGPIIGGLLSKAQGWHFIFWFLIMLTAVVALPMLFLLPETCRKIVGDGSIPPQRWNRSIMNGVIERGAIKEGRAVPWDRRDELARKRHVRFPNPFNTVKIIFEKEAGFALIYIALVCSGLYAALALIPSQFGSIYHFNEIQISLCYIPIGAGCVLAAFTRGPVIDSRFKHHAKRLGISIDHGRRPDLTDFPIERARLEVALPTLYVGTACLIAFGWTVQYKANLAGPLILLFLIGFCNSATMNSVAVLLIDIYPGKAATATAANNLCRCWLGAGATALVVPLITAIGIGWTCTLYGMIILASSPGLFYIMKQGPKWRREKKEKTERKLREIEGRADIGGEKGSGKAEVVPS